MAVRKSNPDKALTARQRMVLVFICEFRQEHSYAPTIREIGEFMGISSTNGVKDHLKALERKKWIECDKGLSRAIRVLRMPEGLTVYGAEDLLGTLREVYATLAGGLELPSDPASARRLLVAATNRMVAQRDQLQSERDDLRTRLRKLESAPPPTVLLDERLLGGSLRRTA